jgi:hypothetical protein
LLGVTHLKSSLSVIVILPLTGHGIARSPMNCRAADDIHF